MKKLKVFAGIINSDLTEGRGHDVVLGYFEDSRDAGQAVKGENTMGSDGRVEPTELVIYESFSEYADQQRTKLRERALSKLTYEEREALGL